MVTVWDVASVSERLTFTPAGTPWSVTFHPDGRSLMVAEFDSQRIGIYSIDDGREIGFLPTPGFNPENAVVDPTGARVALPSQNSRESSCGICGRRTSCDQYPSVT